MFCIITTCQNKIMMVEGPYMTMAEAQSNIKIIEKRHESINERLLRDGYYRLIPLIHTMLEPD